MTFIILCCDLLKMLLLYCMVEVGNFPHRLLVPVPFCPATEMPVESVAAAAVASGQNLPRAMAMSCGRCNSPKGNEYMLIHRRRLT